MRCASISFRTTNVEEPEYGFEQQGRKDAKEYQKLNRRWTQMNADLKPQKKTKRTKKIFHRGLTQMGAD